MVDQPNHQEVGYVISAQDYLINLEGLPSAKVNDILISKKGGRAIVNVLDKNKVEALMLDAERPHPGDLFTLSDVKLSAPLHTELFGRAINPLGEPVDGKGSFPPGGKEVDLDIVAPGIDAREVVSEQFFTGITVIDTLIPIGKGQRELMFGEPRSGKSSFILDLIVNQKGEGRICIYVAIGKADIEVKRFIQDIEREKASDYTVIISSTSSDAAPLISIAPSYACAVAEHYRNAGKNVLMIMDDFGTHSKYLREIGLLSGRVPGRESYPPDIFFQHSRLVERAGNFNDKWGSGSITMIPVIETDLESFTNLIPTNVMSMTDGHLLFSSALRASGQYPAIEVDKSVTRVGRQTQFLLHKILSDRIRSLLTDYHELERFGRFGAELTAETQLIIKRGMITGELLRQEPLEKIKPYTQILYLSLVFAGFFDTRDTAYVRKFKRKIIEVLDSEKAFTDLAAKVKEMELDAVVASLKENLKILEEKCK